MTSRSDCVASLDPDGGTRGARLNHGAIPLSSRSDVCRLMTGPEVASAHPSDCELVRWHSRQKHEFIAQYLSVWTTKVAKNPKKTPPTLEIVDLFAGRGWCRADSDEERGAPELPWPGTAVLAARALNNYPRASRLILNSFHRGGHAEIASQQKCLKKAIETELGKEPRFPVDFLAERVEDAAQKAAALFDRRFPSIWILDPCTPEDLPWSVVEQIAGLKHQYSTREGGPTTIRRPELVISLITEGLQRNVDRNPGLISKALGLPEAEWRPRVDELLDEGFNTRQAIVYLFSERLRELYQNVPTVVEVPGSHGNIVYVLVFCSSHSAGAYMARMRVRPEFERWQIVEWKPLAKLISRNRVIRRTQGVDATVQQSLDRF